MPAAPVELQDEDATIAELLKNDGYATGQYGENHLRYKYQFLPTVHGFDEFFGNLYHLHARPASRSSSGTTAVACTSGLTSPPSAAARPGSPPGGMAEHDGHVGMVLEATDEQGKEIDAPAVVVRP